MATVGNVTEIDRILNEKLHDQNLVIGIMKEFGV